jgi:hypothetical protein
MHTERALLLNLNLVLAAAMARQGETAMNKLQLAMNVQIRHKSSNKFRRHPRDCAT